MPSSSFNKSFYLGKRVKKMCDSCWDLDRREFALKQEGCDGKLTPFLSMAELKKRIEEKFLKENKTNHVVIRDSVIEPESDRLVWEAFDPSGTKKEITVRLV